VTILQSAFEVKILPKQNIYASKLLQFKPLEAPGVIEGGGGGGREGGWGEAATPGEREGEIP
jgi:hypothetical protein